jgi:2-phospho-L-lactate/phosphoenolpyruvate guanylyltransferase
MQVLAVPVKGLDRSKRRLSTLLAPQERARLTLAMLEGVLDAGMAQPGWDVWVVSASEPVLETAVRTGARPVPDGAGSLQGAVRQVERELAAASPGAALAVLLADLPLITAGALGRTLGRSGAVVAAPAASHGGTNLLLRRPGSVIPNRFGPSSFEKHRAEALRAGVMFREVADPVLAFDLDTAADLARLIDAPGGGPASAALTDLALAERLGVRATG